MRTGNCGISPFFAEEVCLSKQAGGCKDCQNCPVRARKKEEKEANKEKA